MARRAQRGTRRATRKSKGKLRLFGRVYSPLHHLLQATRNVSDSVFQRTGKIVKEGIGAVDNVGKSVTDHANMAVRNITGKRKNRKNSRKSRKASTRRNRK